MHTLAAFYASITNGTALGPVAGVADQSLVADSGNRIQVPGPWQLLAGFALGANLSRVQVNAPSFRGTILPEVFPSQAAAAIPSVSQPDLWLQNGPRFAGGDYFIPQVSRAGADAQPVTVLTWIGPAFAPAPQGRIYTLYGTVTPTLTAGTWVLAAPVWDQQLPVGNYHCVGMAVVANDAVACRLVFPGGAQYRPGVVTHPTYSSLICGDPFRMGRFGHYGTFAYNAMPQIEVLGLAAGAEAVSVFLDLVKA